MNKDDLILWIDVEANTSDVERGELLEIGIIVSDMSGNELNYKYESLFKVDIVNVLKNTDDFVKKMHEDSGLWKDLWKNGGKTREEIDAELVEWIDHIINEFPHSKLYFGGNSITLDRSFIRTYLPNFYKKLSFRSIDVTSISLAVQGNSHINGYEKKNAHRAILDVKDSLNEYNHYLDKLKLS